MATVKICGMAVVLLYFIYSVFFCYRLPSKLYLMGTINETLCHEIDISYLSAQNNWILNFNYLSLKQFENHMKDL